MATTTKEKVPVDHTAISGPKKEEPPKSDFLSAMQDTVGKTVAAMTALPAPAPSPAPVKSALSGIKKGRLFSPPRILLVGTEGIGKSSWAAAAPAPIFIPTEDRQDHIDCERFTWDGGQRKKANTYAEVIEALAGLATEPHHYQTLVMDSADWLERLIWANVCRRSGVSNIEKVEKGYGKGYTFALDEWREILDLETKCRARGMAIINIAHAKIEKFEDPELPAYDRYAPKLHKFAAAILKEWSDCVLFASFKRTVKLVEGKGTDERPIGVNIGANGGERVIRTVGGTVDAKNSYQLPAEIPLSWDAFADGLTKFMNSSNVA